MTATEKIILNSFVRRTDNTDGLKALIKATGAQLTRKGRSRNWLLGVNSQQRQQIIEQLSQADDETSWQWLAKLLIDTREPTSFAELLSIISNDPAITVKQLMALTDCTIGQARAALDEIEWS